VTVGGLPKQFFDFRSLGLIGNGMRMISKLFELIFWLIVGWVIVTVTPLRSRRILDEIESRPVLSAVWGFFGFLRGGGR
jgi:hypothetical protein